MSTIGDGKVFCSFRHFLRGKELCDHALREAESFLGENGPRLADFTIWPNMIKETFPDEYGEMAQGLDHTEIAHAIVDVFYKEKEAKVSDLAFLRWKSGSYSENRRC